MKWGLIRTAISALGKEVFLRDKENLLHFRWAFKRENVGCFLLDKNSLWLVNTQVNKEQSVSRSINCVQLWINKEVSQTFEINEKHLYSMLIIMKMPDFFYLLCWLQVHFLANVMRLSLWKQWISPYRNNTAKLWNSRSWSSSWFGQMIQ